MMDMLKRQDILEIEKISGLGYVSARRSFFWGVPVNGIITFHPLILESTKELLWAFGVTFGKELDM